MAPELEPFHPPLFWRAALSQIMTQCTRTAQNHPSRQPNHASATIVRYTLGLAHADANGTHRSISQDWVLALEYLGLAGEQGHLVAYLSTGEVHLQMAETRSDETAAAHERANATKAFEKAKVQLVESAKAGDMNAQRRLGGLYDSGHERIGIDMHGLKAFKWYERAANQGCKESMAKVSQFYAEGIRAVDDGKGRCTARKQ